MKKTYSTPVIDIEKFDIVDVITDSAATPNSYTIDEVNGEKSATVEW